MNEDKISVIIPVYNAEKIIEHCVSSVNPKNVEIILVDDGSKDESLEICKKLSNLNKNIKVFHQENQGPALARRLGVEKASRDYVMFLDCDDYYESNTISRMAEIIEKYNDPDLIRFRYKKIPDGYDQYEYFPETEKFIEKNDFKNLVFPMFLNGYMLNAIWSNCVKRKIVKNSFLTEQDMRLRYGEDLLLNLNIFSNVENAVFINDILYDYISKSDSTTTTQDRKRLSKNLRDSIYVYTALFEYIKKWEMDDEKTIRLVRERVIKEMNAIMKRMELNQ